MPLGSRLDGEVNERMNSKGENREKEYLIEKQAGYIYRKVRSGNLINKSTMRQEIDHDTELDKMDDTSGSKKLYRELIVNNAGRIENTLSQMEQWSILSNVINYAQYNKHPKSFYSISVRPINKMKNNIKSRKDEKERPKSEIDFRDASNRLGEEYLDKYDGIKSEILSTTRFNENSNLSMTYLGKVNVAREKKMTTEEKFLISEQGYTTWKLLDGTECQMLLDSRTSKSFMSKPHYLHCKSPQSLPKFVSKTQRIQVGNGQYVSTLFVILIIVDIHGHRFEVYALTSEIHENVDLVLGFRNKECFWVRGSNKLMGVLF